jgi:hypothetical protein
MAFAFNARPDSLDRRSDSLVVIIDTVAALQNETSALSEAIIDIPYPEISDLIVRKRYPDSWLFFVSCLAFLLYGFNRVINIKRHDKLVFGSLSGSSTKSNEGVFFELSIHQILSLPILSIIFAMAIYIWLPIPVSSVFKKGINFYLFIASIIMLVYCIKLFFYYLVISILKLKEVPSFFVNNILMITYSAAIFALPFILLNIFSPYAVISEYAFWMSIFSFAVFFVIRLFRITLAIASSFPYSIFYLFLYLCCLEIMPWIVLFKAYGFWV